jgi:L-ascorbate metabolism protein UlaG (beta-lactamase superfamily)
MQIPVRCLGQSGFRLDLGGTILYTDPYLSDSVESLEGSDFRRMRPTPVRASDITDADLVLISHGHRDHCDPDTLGPLANSSGRARFVCPNEVSAQIAACGVATSRIATGIEQWSELAHGVRVLAVAAAHPEVARDAEQQPRCLGYVIEWNGRRLYHAGDTSVSESLVEALGHAGPIDVAFLPVNECNFYRARRGIIGNMSVRDAFSLAHELGIRAVVPMHFDMFQPNSVLPEEILLVYRSLKPSFDLLLEPEYV